ncbi:MAG: DedA family protein [Corynebacterium sp.]|uniref:DedA family protein n=1 Tax=Corynebacterium sp. TaxID=1720 RepID=UPI0026DFD089|nr:DedA family protein [Corynebacterium sp.]MDO5668506.1 DedA family protein [Corynebacterium sp.]
MTELLITWVETLLTLPAFYPVLAALVVTDSLVPLIPSEAVLTLAGTWSGARGVPALGGIIGVAITAAIIGDNICYLLGTRLIGIVERTPADTSRGRAITWVRENIRRNAATTIIIARFIPWARWFMTIMLGSVRYPWRWFFLYDTIGVVLWALLATLIGYAGGWYFSEYPLLGVVVGISFGGLVGTLIQWGQRRWTGRR